MEPTSPTPIACNAADTGEENILDIHTANDDDGPWSSEDDHKSDRNTRFKNGTYCGMMTENILQNYPKQVMREFLSWTQKHHHVDASTPVSQRKPDEACSPKEDLVRTKCKSRGMFRKQRRTLRLDSDPCFSRHTKETDGADRRNYTASVPHETHIADTATLSASTDPDGGLTDHVPKDATITERHFNLATEQATMHEVSLHCVDSTAELNIAFAPIRERPEQPGENKMLNLRVALSQTTVFGRLRRQTQQSLSK